MLPEDDGGKSLVFQVKFARKPPEDVDKWIMAAAEGEREKVERLKAKGVRQYYFISNVVGTAHLDVGSIDRLEPKLAALLGLAVVCWWRDDLNRRLDSNWDIKLRYPETLSGQDFFRLLLSLPRTNDHKRQANAIRAFISDQYSEDQEVRFKQVELQNKLLDLFVDLPFSLHFKRPSKSQTSNRALQLQMLADLRPDDSMALNDTELNFAEVGTATLLLSETDVAELSQVVIEGAPGQGKSTLVQYVCQVHRIRLLNKSAELAHLPVKHRTCLIRIPFKVDLRDLSEWLAGNDPFATTKGATLAVPDARSLETFLAHLVSQRSGGLRFEAEDLIQFSQSHPLFVALDGLDEVADIKRRTEVVSAVSKAVWRMRENCPQLQVVVTSRPAAFANSPGFDQTAFPRIELGSVTRAQISEYAGRWIAARKLQTKEISEFHLILNEKMDQPHLRDLARNPMQLTILLSLILTKGAALPDKRTTLYDQYVDVFFGRESTKSQVVRKHLDLLKDIHRYLAWQLHTAAELGRTAAAGRFTTDELTQSLTAYLKREGQPVDIVDEIFNAMLERVVMIVSRIEGTYEFEVQPLREYFAARFLYDTASYSPPGGEKAGTKPDRFDAVARNPYWLNVARFLCGCFSKGELLDLAERVNALLTEGPLAKTRHPATLAAMLLSDWVFSQSPKAAQQVANQLAERQILFRLLPSVGYRAEDATRIPPNTGGQELVDAARQWIVESTTNQDVLRRLGSFISANASPDENLNWWLELPLKSSDQGRWLMVGDAMGVLDKCPQADLSAILNGVDLGVRSMSILWNSALSEVVLSRSEHVDRLRRYMLAAPRWFDDERVASPLHLVPIIIQSACFPGQAAFHSIAEASVQYRALPEPKRRLEQSSPGYDFEQQCLRLTEAALARLDQDIPVDTQVWWEPLLVDCEAVFGAAPAIVLMALGVTGFRRGTPGRTRRVHLLEHREPLLTRFRYAKYKARDAAWWKGELQLTRTSEDRILWSLAFWHLASSTVTSDSIDMITEVYEGFEKREWDALLMILMHAFRSQSIRVQHKRQRSTLRIRSKRVAFLLAMRDPDTYAENVFFTHFVDSTDDFFGVSRFRQREALMAAAKGELDWRTALDIVETCYRSGESIYAITPSLTRAIKEFPSTAVDRVLGARRAFPAVLVDFAFETSKKTALRDVKAVGSVAKRDHWFD